MSRLSSRGGWLTIAGFLLLCLLWASDSLRGDLLPGAGVGMPPVERQALEFGLLAAGAAVFALARRRTWPSGQRALAWVLVGAGLFLVPGLLVHFARDWIGALTRVALFSLVPVFAVVAEPYVGLDEPMPSGHKLLAALAGVTGTFLVFPVDMPGSLAAGAGWCAVMVAALCIAAANCRAVFLAHDFAEASLAPVIAIGCGTASAGFALASLLTEHPLWSVGGAEVAWMVTMTLPSLLLFWLMRRMNAAAMTTRYVVAPLIANLIGLALLRPTVSLRAGLGLALIAAGAGWLLLARAGKQEKTDTPQTLHLE